MKMNKINSSFLALLAMAALSSCMSEVDTQPTASIEGNAASTKVTFSVGNGSAIAMTRAATDGTTTTVADLTNENTINTVHAVVFNGGKFYRLIPTTLKSGETDVYEFDMGNAGSYTMYLLANAEDDLVNATTGKIVGIGANGTAEDYYKLIADQKPGDQASATRFLMTSAARNVPIQASSQTGTDLTDNPIDLTRATARIDIDTRNLSTSAQTFRIKDVKVHNYYPKTVIYRAPAITDMTLPADVKTFADAKETAGAYTYSSIGTTGADEDLSTIYVATDPVGTDDHTTRQLTANVWDGIIYTYENKTPVTLASQITDPSTAITNGVTVLEIIGDMNGIEVTQNVVFAYVDGTDPTVAHEIPVERNHLYSVVLSLKDVPSEYAPFEATITVLDWKTGETVVYTSANLTDQTSVPDFEVTSTGGGTLKQADDSAMPAADDASTLLVNETILNPGKIIDVPNTGGTITLRVVSQQTSARLVFAEATGQSIDGATVTCTSESVDNSTDPNNVPYYIQNYSIVLGDNSATGCVARNYTFRVENGLGRAAKREFTITQLGE